MEARGLKKVVVRFGEAILELIMNLEAAESAQTHSSIGEKIDMQTADERLLEVQTHQRYFRTEKLRKKGASFR